MREFWRFLTVLREELAAQEKLLELLARESAAIVQLKQAEISQLTEEKEELLSQANALGESRNKLLSSITGESSSQPRLGDILNHCADKHIQNELRSVGTDLKETALRVQELNDHNAQLLKQSLGLIASTITIFRGCPESDLPVYTRGGTIKQDEVDPAFVQRKSLLTREA